jgi:hypothetical protein
MKKIILTFSLLITFAISISAQNGIIILTEEMMIASPYTTTVHVTLANGTITSSNIPSEQTSVANHDTALSSIINGITALGYKLIQAPEGWGYYGLQNSRGVRRLFFAQP